MWLVIDNLSVHYAYALKKAYEPFHLLFLPPYTSPLNPQEHVWAATKRELAVHFARLNHPVTTQVGFEAEVDYILSQIKRKQQPQREEAMEEEEQRFYCSKCVYRCRTKKTV